MRSDDENHGPNGEIPDHVNLDSAETVGTEEVEMDYPDERDVEKIVRLCPYCEQPFRGKHGVMIHLGQTAGRKNHPEDAAERHDPDDFTIVHLDENENIIEVVEAGSQMPSRINRESKDSEYVELIEEYIADLRSRGKHEEAARAAAKLLSE